MRIERLYRYPVKGLTAEALEEVARRGRRRAAVGSRLRAGPGRCRLRRRRSPSGCTSPTSCACSRMPGSPPCAPRFDPHDRCLTIRAPDGACVVESPMTAGRGASGSAPSWSATWARRRGAKPASTTSRPRLRRLAHAGDQPDGLSSLHAFERRHRRRSATRCGSARNIYFSGSPPWAEFDWVDRTIQVGGATLRVIKRTRRCNATQVNPQPPSATPTRCAS